jgi:hypothetical protein
MGTGQFPETWVFEQFATIKFSLAESRIRVGMFSYAAGNNSFPTFRVCWWFGNTKTDRFVTTKPPKHPEEGDGVSYRNSGTQDRGFFGGKNPQHAFLRRKNKAACPMSQICGM